VPAQGPAAATPTLVLIIDDIGHRLDTGRAATRLPGRVNLAVLPFTPHAAELAEAGFASGKEIMLHAPMSSQVAGDTEPEPLTADLPEPDFRALLARQLDAVPYVRGVNNHMGSELTRQPEAMAWLMSELVRRELYFVDSRTTADTVAAASAREAGVPHLSRRVFLDNDPNEAAIEERFEYAIAEARRMGVAVAIGHPYPETMAFLQRVLPTLGERSIRLAWVSERADLNGAGYPAPISNVDEVDR
jgi:polysaccharide deacetylase 2 family uncharacterized protein YibQ